METKLLWYSAVGKLAETLLPEQFSSFMQNVALENISDSHLTISFNQPYNLDFKFQVEDHLLGILDELSDPPLELDYAYKEFEYKAEETPNNSIELNRIVQGLRQEYLHSERNHVLPAYLFRWLPYFRNPKLFWSLIGFRQAYYGIHRESPKAGKAFQISSRFVSSLCGVNRETLEKYRDMPMMQWFLRYERTNEYSFSNDAPKRKAFRYSFVAAAPPTPQDQEHLTNWLINNGVKDDPEACLKTLLNTEAGLILPLIPDAPEPRHLEQAPVEMSFDKLVLSLCPLEVLEEEARGRVLSLALKAADYLVASFGLAFIPIYFMRHWVPLMGHAPALATILLRRTAGFYNPRTQELREEGLYKGGIKALSTRMGVKPYSLRNFLVTQKTRPEQEAAALSDSYASRKRTNQTKRIYFEQFVPEKSALNGDLKVRIAMLDPLIPEHESEFDSVARIIAQYMTFPFVQSAPEAYAEYFVNILRNNDFFSLISPVSQERKDSSVPTNEDIAFPAISDSSIPANSDSAVSSIVDSSNQANGDSVFPAIQDSSISAIQDLDNSAIGDLEKWAKGFRNSSQFKLIKYLNPNTFKQYLIHITTNHLPNKKTSQESTNDPRINWTLPLGEEWNVDNIINQSPLTQKEKTEFLALSPNPKAVISHLLLVLGPEKDQFKYPWKFVLSKLRDNPQKAYNGVFSYLSHLSPHAMRELCQNTIFIGDKLVYEGTQTSRVQTVWMKYVQGLDGFDMATIAESLCLAEWE